MNYRDQEERSFLEHYSGDAYEKLSLTVDILIFTMSKGFQLEILLKKRTEHPYKGKWALPGGFVGVEESLDDAVSRVLREKTGLTDLQPEQLYTFGAKDRDPRMRIVSVAYLVILPRECSFETEADSALFSITFTPSGLKITGMEHDPERGRKRGRETNAEIKLETNIEINIENDIAFDHMEMVTLAIERMRGKLHYTDIGLQFLKNPSSFTLYELQKIYEGIEAKSYDIPNFRRYFKNRYEAELLVEKTGESSTEFSKRPSAIYRLKNEEKQ